MQVVVPPAESDRSGCPRAPLRPLLAADVVASEVEAIASDGRPARDVAAPVRGECSGGTLAPPSGRERALSRCCALSWAVSGLVKIVLVGKSATK